MLKRAILIVQTHLKDKGFFAGTANGETGPDTDRAVLRGLTARQAEIPPDALGFTQSRRMTMMFQLICKDRDIDCDPVDGFWGPVTQNAYETLVQVIDEGTRPPNWRDDEPSDANPNTWPRDTGNQSAMRAFYGQPGSPAMTRVRCPWTLRLAWDKSTRLREISVNSKVAPSVTRVFDRIIAHYGEAELQRLRLDLFGGCFAARKKRGGSSWSTHAWAVALDFDPERNQLKWGRDRASMDDSAYDFWWHTWEAEGWVSLGRSRNFDWMHVQAARL